MIQLNEKDLLTHCNTMIFNRGHDYYVRNNVSFMSVDLLENTSHDVVNIDAAVWGSYGSLYDVVISFDNYKNFLHHHCDCEYHNTTGRMCKHIVAVLLKYITDYRRYFKTEITSKNGKNNFLNLLNSELQQPIERVPLTLQVILNAVTYGSGSDYSISLKVGCEKLYVVKELPFFLACVKNKSSLEFGKFFTYNPKKHYFKDDDKKIIDYLHQLNDINSFFSTVPYNYSIMRGKTAVIPQESFKTLLSLLHQKNFTASLYGKSYDSISIVEKKLPLSFKIFESGNQFVIKNDETLPVPLIDDHSYYLFEDRIFHPPVSQTKLFKHFYKSFNDKNEIIVQKKDFDQISSVVFPAISELCSDLKVHKNLKENINTNPLFAKLYLDKENLSLSCKIVFTYGSESFNPFSKSKLIGMIFRNMAKEKSIISKVEDLGFNLLKNEKLYMDNEDNILNLLKHDFDSLKDCCDVYYSENFKNIQIRNSTHISSSVKLSTNNLLEFKFDIDGIEKDELSSLLSSLKIRKKFFRLKNGDFLSLENEDTQAFFNDLRYLGLSDKELKKDTLTFPKYKALSMGKILADNELVDLKYDNYCENLISKISKISESDYPPPDNLKDVLRDYQRTGFSWFKTLASCNLGGILADEMGLGKTLQAISFIQSIKDESCDHPSLVVSPTSLVFNWESEFEKFAPDLKTLVITGSKPKRNELMKTLGDYDVIITSYPLIRSDICELESFHFSAFFIDEAQFIKNPSSQSAGAVKRINSDVKFALTGTPIENNLSELWSIFDFIMPGYLNSYSSFKDNFENPIIRNSNKVAMKKLSRVIKPFILRRKKLDVVSELPPKISHDIIVELTESQKKLYSSFVDEYKSDYESSVEAVGFNQSKFKLLSILTRLRQICCDPSIFVENYSQESSKITSLTEIVKSSLESNHRLLVFSQFTSVLKNIREKFYDEGISTFYLDGSTPGMERLDMVNRFNAGENDVFLISLKAGGTGLNLTGADTVIHFDPWWNPAVENQATDRAHRIGQVKTVEVIRLIAKGTIEEKISELQKRKQELFDNIVENAADTNILKSMSVNDILELFN